MRAFRRYATLLARPGLRSVVVLSVLCRLPMGMTPLAVLLLVREGTGSFATAGLTTGVYAAAVALVAPARSRMVDRSGMTLVLATSGVAYPLGMIGLLLAAGSGVADTVVVALGLVSGLAYPPVAAVMRALWTSLVPDEAGRRTAFSLESVLVETAFVLGPLAVAVAVAVGSPGAAVLASALLVAVGSVGLAASSLVRSWSPTREAPRRIAGPLASRPLRSLLAVTVCLGAAIGAVEVAVPAYAAAAGSPAAGGVLIAVWSLGSIAGGLWYGGRDFDSPPSAHYPWLLALLAAGHSLPLLAVGPLSLGLLLVGSGLTLAPLMTCNAALVSRFAPPGTVTEAFGWSTSALFAGVAGGTAAGGALVETAGVTSALLLAAGAGGVALLVGLARRRRLTGAVAVAA